MEIQQLGPLRFIRGDNRGRYPYCHSLLVEEAGVLIDPSSNRGVLADLSAHGAVSQVWLSHWHEDHLMHLDLFDGLPLWISEQDAPPLNDIEVFLDWYLMEDRAERDRWKGILEEQFHYRPRLPRGFLRDGGIIDLGGVTVEVLLTPGHTPGHCALFFREPGVLFLGDYDLTPFGPWYGDRFSSLEDTITSIRRLKAIPAEVWITAHETGVFESPPGDLWERYEGIIYDREARLLDLLHEPRTFQEIVGAWIIYGRPREPRDFFEFGERLHMRKHLEHLMRRGLVYVQGDGYRRID